MQGQCEHSREQHPLAKNSALQMHEQVMHIRDAGPFLAYTLAAGAPL